MSQSKNFIDPGQFADIIGQIVTLNGDKYHDLSTIYGDLSRLVVAIIATTDPHDLQKIYNKLGWCGKANVRAMHEASKYWYKTYHPNRIHN